MYIYEGHLGTLYATEEPLSFDKLYCEECGDSDFELGEANTAKEAWNLLKERTDINGSGGYLYDYVKAFLEEFFGQGSSSVMPKQKYKDLDKYEF